MSFRDKFINYDFDNGDENHYCPQILFQEIILPFLKNRKIDCVKQFSQTITINSRSGKQTHKGYYIGYCQLASGEFKLLLDHHQYNQQLLYISDNDSKCARFDFDGTDRGIICLLIEKMINQDESFFNQLVKSAEKRYNCETKQIEKKEQAKQKRKYENCDKFSVRDQQAVAIKFGFYYLNRGLQQSGTGNLLHPHSYMTGQVWDHLRLSWDDDKRLISKLLRRNKLDDLETLDRSGKGLYNEMLDIVGDQINQYLEILLNDQTTAVRKFAVFYLGDGSLNLGLIDQEEEVRKATKKKLGGT